MRDLERCRDRFRKSYVNVEDIDEHEFTIGFESQKSRRIGFKVTSTNAVDLVTFGLRTRTLGTVRLAPYENWDSFARSAKANLETFISVVGRPTINRLGARFINRVDIPAAELNTSHVSQYFNIRTVLPDTLTLDPNAYYTNVQALHPNTGAKIVLQHGSAIPVLIDHASFLLDIDASFDSDIPTRLEDLWEKFEILRRVKNEAFEASITERTRGLFR